MKSIVLEMNSDMPRDCQICVDGIGHWFHRAQCFMNSQIHKFSNSEAGFMIYLTNNKHVYTYVIEFLMEILNIAMKFNIMFEH